MSVDFTSHSETLPSGSIVMPQDDLALAASGSCAARGCRAGRARPCGGRRRSGSLRPCARAGSAAEGPVRLPPPPPIVLVACATSTPLDALAAAAADVATERRDVDAAARARGLGRHQRAGLRAPALRLARRSAMRAFACRDAPPGCARGQAGELSRGRPGCPWSVAFAGFGVRGPTSGVGFSATSAAPRCEPPRGAPRALLGLGHRRRRREPAAAPPDQLASGAPAPRSARQRSGTGSSIQGKQQARRSAVLRQRDPRPASCGSVRRPRRRALQGMTRARAGKPLRVALDHPLELALLLLATRASKTLVLDESHSSCCDARSAVEQLLAPLVDFARRASRRPPPRVRGPPEGAARHRPVAALPGVSQKSSAAPSSAAPRARMQTCREQAVRLAAARPSRPRRARRRPRAALGPSRPTSSSLRAVRAPCGAYPSSGRLGSFTSRSAVTGSGTRA